MNRHLTEQHHPKPPPPRPVPENEATAQASGSDGVGAGLQAFVKALGAAQPAPSGPQPDPKVSQAFALGWQMSELYRAKEWRNVAAASADRLPDDLPGLGSIGRRARAKLGIDQVDVALSSLGDQIKGGGLTVASTKTVRDALAAGIDDEFLLAVLNLHLDLLSALTAADFKLGKAYGLGRALADTSRKPTDLQSLRAELKAERIAHLRAWIGDLTSTLPAHAGHSVNASLKQWTDWAANGKSPGADDPGRAIRLLRRQGERWRALLSGEKQGPDLLELGDYVSAAFGLLKRFGALSVRFLVPFSPLVLAIVGLFVAGIVFLANSTHSGHVAAGIGGLLASAGLTWKGVGSSLGKAVSHVERPLWQAELDAAITTAITLLPGSKRAEGYTPPEDPPAETG
jgi:hypothetical protein